LRNALHAATSLSEKTAAASRDLPQRFEYDGSVWFNEDESLIVSAVLSLQPPRSQ
jgi:hypothetical protein